MKTTVESMIEFGKDNPHWLDLKEELEVMKQMAVQELIKADAEHVKALQLEIQIYEDLQVMPEVLAGVKKYSTLVAAKIARKEGNDAS